MPTLGPIPRASIAAPIVKAASAHPVPTSTNSPAPANATQIPTVDVGLIGLGILCAFVALAHRAHPAVATVVLAVAIAAIPYTAWPISFFSVTISAGFFVWSQLHHDKRAEAKIDQLDASHKAHEMAALQHHQTQMADAAARHEAQMAILRSLLEQLESHRVPNDGQPARTMAPIAPLLFESLALVNDLWAFTSRNHDYYLQKKNLVARSANKELREPIEASLWGELQSKTLNGFNNEFRSRVNDIVQKYNAIGIDTSALDEQLADRSASATYSEDVAVLLSDLASALAEKAKTNTR